MICATERKQHNKQSTLDVTKTLACFIIQNDGTVDSDFFNSGFKLNYAYDFCRVYSVNTFGVDQLHTESPQWFAPSCYS